MDAIRNVAGNVARRKVGGFALTSELVLVSTITVLGVTAGLVALRDATMAELEDLSEAVGALDQSYGFQGISFLAGDSTALASVAGSLFLDTSDTAAGDITGWEFTAVSGTSEVSAFTFGGVDVNP